MISRGSLLAVFLVFPAFLYPQSVVSVHSGVVHYFEGSVSLNGQVLQERFGRFPEILPGAELRTDQGRAEILLTPGILLRVDENSSIRMVSNRLADTRVEFVGGSVTVDAQNAPAHAPILLTFGKYEIRLKASGAFRVDSAPARIRVDEGSVDVALNGHSVSVDSQHAVALTPALSATAVIANPDDGLDRWSRNRSQAVEADNASAVASDNLSANLDTAQDSLYSGAYGGGYGLGGDPTLFSSGDLWSAQTAMAPISLWSPVSMYAGGMYGFLYFPVFRRSPTPILGYRPYESTRRGTFLPPTHRPMMTTRSAPAAGVHRSGGLGTRGIGHH